MAGAQAARFFRRIVERLEQAESEMRDETERSNVSPEVSARPAPNVRVPDKVCLGGVDRPGVVPFLTYRGPRGMANHMTDLSDGPGGERRRLRVLFVAEAVTLAHVARPSPWREGSTQPTSTAVLAVDPRDQALWKGLTIPVRPIRSISSEQFRNALARGHPLYDVETLRAYVREDLEVIEETAQTWWLVISASRWPSAPGSRTPPTWRSPMPTGVLMAASAFPCRNCPSPSASAYRSHEGCFSSPAPSRLPTIPCR